MKKVDLNLITFTPVVRNSKCFSKNTSNYFNYQLQNQDDFSLKTNFKSVVNNLSIQESIKLKSLNLRIQFKNVDKVKEFSNMYQWYKDLSKDIQLTTTSINNINFVINKNYTQYLSNSIICKNFIFIQRLIDQIKYKEKNQLLKFYFGLCQQFIKNNKEYKENERKFLCNEHLVKNFFVFAWDFDSLVRNINQFNFEKIIEITKSDYFDFWKVLFLLAQTIGKHLPIWIQKRIIELEHKLLLKYIWQIKNESEINEAQIILNSNSRKSEILIKRLLNILAERLYLLTKELVKDDQLNEKIWQVMKNYIFNNTSYPCQIHLDQILILSIYHITCLNRKYLKFKDLVDLYRKKVLFPAVVIREDLMDYYQNQFKKKLGVKNINLIIPHQSNKQKKTNPNSTPIYTKKINRIIGSPLIDNLLRKRKHSIESCASFKKSRKESFHNLLNIPPLDFKNSKDKLQPQNLFKLDSITDNTSPSNVITPNIFNNEKFQFDINDKNSIVNVGDLSNNSGAETPKWGDN